MRIIMRFSLGEMLKAFTKTRFKSPAVTVGELVVTTVVVGVVAILTIGGINHNIQLKAMSAQQILLDNDLAIAMANMQADGKLKKYNTQEEFFEVFKNYLRKF